MGLLAPIQSSGAGQGHIHLLSRQTCSKAYPAVGDVVRIPFEDLHNPSNKPARRDLSHAPTSDVGCSRERDVGNAEGEIERSQKSLRTFGIPKAQGDPHESPYVSDVRELSAYLAEMRVEESH